MHPHLLVLRANRKERYNQFLYFHHNLRMEVEFWRGDTKRLFVYFSSVESPVFRPLASSAFPSWSFSALCNFFSGFVSSQYMNIILFGSDRLTFAHRMVQYLKTGAFFTITKSPFLKSSFSLMFMIVPHMDFLPPVPQLVVRCHIINQVRPVN